MAARARNLQDLQAMAAELPRSRQQFIRDVENAAARVVDAARQVAPAIGEISLDEAKDAMTREFASKLLGQG